MTTKKKDILETINHIKKIFPFSDSTDNDREEYIDLKQNSHLNIAYNVCEYLKKGSTVLDFGSGPLDKTSIIKKLGYNCYAIDDLADDWHLKKRVKLLFGKTNYVDYKSYFMHDGSYFRGHIREYSKDCLIQLCKYMDYEIIKLKGCHQMLNKLPNFFILPWKLITYFFSNLSDSYILIAKKLKN